MRERLLGLSLSVQALETCVVEAGADVPTCYERPADPLAAAPIGTSLVVQADGTGVPMVQPPTQTPPGRLGQGQQRGTQQEAVVTGLDTIAPDPHTPQAVVAAWLPEPGGPEPAARPRPAGQARRATWARKAVARRRLAPRVAPREGPASQPRVALSAGAEALPQPLAAHVPAYTRGLDISHATADLWATANALLGETHPQRRAWVRAYLEPLLAGPTEAVITALEAEMMDPTCTGTPRQAGRRTVGSDRRHQPDRHDDAYRARGGPMGTGGVEGACGHLVNDRMEPSGMRWTTTGAQAVLDLRAVRLNGHGEAYWPFHRHPQHQRLYGPSAPAQVSAEAQTLELAA